MKLRVNGEERDLEGAGDVAALVEALGLPPRGILVEHNGLALRPAEWAYRALAEGDQVEIIRIVAGG